MKRRRLALAAPALVLVFCAAVNDQTQADMNEEACRGFEAADRQMNQLYSRILDEYSQDPTLIEKLSIAQRAWVAFRDAHVESIYPAPEKRVQYGSVYPMCRCYALRELTDQRARELRRWVEGMREGDVCAGSRKIGK